MNSNMKMNMNYNQVYPQQMNFQQQQYIPNSNYPPNYANVFHGPNFSINVYQNQQYGGNQNFPRDIPGNYLPYQNMYNNNYQNEMFFSMQQQQQQNFDKGNLQGRK